MTKPTRYILVLLALALSGCASYPYYGHDGVYYGKDYYGGYSGYGYGYGYYQPYYYNPYSSYYYSRSSYYYPYYPYYGYYGGGDNDRDDDDRGDGRDENASDELRRITNPPGIVRPPLSGSPTPIRRAKQVGDPVTVDRQPHSARRELQRINIDLDRTPVRRNFDPQPAPREPAHTPSPQPRRSISASRPESRSGIASPPSRQRQRR